jgi:hypothetical protein
MPDDALPRLVRGAHRTLGGDGVRFRETIWTDPPPEGVTDADMRVAGEADLAGGLARSATTLPPRGGCNMLAERLAARLTALPLVGARLAPHLQDDGDAEGWTHVGPADVALRGLHRLLGADAARDEGDDEHGRRLRFRRRERTRWYVDVDWGWAWLDADGAVRRVQWTSQPVTRPRLGGRPGPRRTWRLLEIEPADGVVVAGPVDGPWRPRDA